MLATLDRGYFAKSSRVDFSNNKYQIKKNGWD